MLSIGPSFGGKRFAGLRTWPAPPTHAYSILIIVVLWATFVAVSHAAGPAPGQAAETNLAGPDTCATCHNEVVKSFAANPHAKPTHTDGNIAVTCDDCHGSGKAHAGSADPGKIKRLKSAEQQDAACTRCHSQIAGPFVYEHDVVKTEGCTACHFAHGGPNPSLLNRAAVNTICQQCHSPSPATPAHNQAAQSQSCTICHAEIHGSNTHPHFFKTAPEAVGKG